MKNIELIISKSIYGNEFCLTMRGHKPNKNFESVLFPEAKHYKDIREAANGVRHVVILLGSDVKIFNDKSAELDAKQYCDHMAFEQFETLEE